MIRIGVIGCGSIAAFHEAALSGRSDVRLTAFCDTDASRAQSFAARHEGSYATADPRDLFRNESIDAVYICTRNDSHAPLGILAAAAGKHIMMEKPLALTQQECAALADAVTRSGVLFMSAFKFRFEPAVERAHRHVPSPLLSIAQVTDTRWPDDFWGNDPVQGGGNVLSQGCHAADLLCHLHGSEPVSVVASGGNMHHGQLPILTRSRHRSGLPMAVCVAGRSGLRPHSACLQVLCAAAGRREDCTSHEETHARDDGRWRADN